MTHHVFATAIAFLFFLNPVVTNGQDRFFEGNFSASWNLAGNWTPADIPNSVSENAIIDGPGFLNANLDTNIFSLGSLTIGEDDSLFMQNGTNLDLNLSPLNNNGSLTIGSSGATTTLRFEVLDFALEGSGIISMTNNFNNRISGISSFGDTTILTIGADHTICGSGQIDSMGIVNLGRIVADQAALLEIDISEAVSVGPFNFLNQGELLATNGGVLELEDGIYGNADGVIRAEDGSFVDLVAFVQVNSGLFETEGTGRIRVPNNGDGQLSGTINNTGIIEVQSLGSFTELEFFPGTELLGSGQVRLSGTGTTSLGPAVTGATLIHNEQHSIFGGSTNGTITVALLNRGTIGADGPSAVLTIDPPTGGLPGTGDFQNEGTLTSINGGNLQLSGGSFNSELGDIVVGDNSIISLNSSAIILKAEFNSEGSGRFLVDGADFSDDITNNALMEFSGATADIRNSIGLSGTGTWRMSSTFNVLRSFAVSDALTHGEEHTIEGYGLVTAVIVNNGDIVGNDVTNQLTLDPTNTDLGNGADFINNGLLVARDGGTLSLANSRFDNSSGQVIAEEGSIVELDNGCDLENGSIDTTGTGQVIIDNGSDIILRGAITNNADIRMLGAGSTTVIAIPIDSSLSGLGSILMTNNDSNNIIRGNSPVSILEQTSEHSIIGSGQIGQGSLRVRNFGLIESRDDVGLTFNPSPLIIEDEANIVNATGGRMIANGGGGIVLEGGTLANQLGAEFQVNTVVSLENSASLINRFGGRMFGDGFVVSELQESAILNEGTLAPGNPIGLLSLLGGFNQGPTGELEIEIQDADNFDSVFVTGDVTLAGNLTVELADGYIPTDEDEFEILNANSIVGSFDNAPGNKLVLPNFTFEVEFDETSVTLTGPVMLGDINQDGEVNLLDVAQFVSLLNAGSFQAEADVNCDGIVDLSDVADFIDLLS